MKSKQKMTGKKTSQVSKAKIKTVSELGELIKNNKTILIVSIKNIRASQYQEITKKLRGRAVVKVPKKNLIFKAIDSSKDETVKKLKEHIKESSAILFSDIDPFELAAELIRKKTFVKAKAGQIAPHDIKVSAGPTELVTGPIISELGSLGIQIQIDKGKIKIRESKVIVKKEEKISHAAADVMNKLDIKPFSVGFIPIAALDIKEGKIYTNIQIDGEETIKELRTAFGKALSFAVSIFYTSEDTIKFLIGKAGMHEKALEKFVKDKVINDNVDNSIKTKENPQEVNIQKQENQQEKQ